MAWNEPNGGKGDGGPPDLDELWKGLNDRLSGMFGRGGAPNTPGPDGGNDGNGGGNQGGNRPPPRGRPQMPQFRLPGMGLIVGLVALFWLASGFYIVNAGERGVVLRFGQYAESTLPGPRWHLPYPFESVEKVNIEQVRTVELGYRRNVKSKNLGESLMLTDDENIIDLQFSVQYVLKDPEDFLFFNRNPDETVMQVAESAMREVVGKSHMDYVLYEGRADVAARATKLMQELLDRYRVGVTVSKVNLQNAQPPEQVQAAFDDAVKAGQDRERLKNEGQAYANDVVPKARGLAARLIAEANGHKQRVVVAAEGDAARFTSIVTEYNKAPQVTRERLYQDAMQQILSSTTKVMVDSKQGQQLLYLPLDKIMQMSVPGAATAASAATVAAPAAAPEAAPARVAPPVDARSRDAARSRDREVR
ncbi:MAG: FtsH protease activity modulator HflK [Betaproteobacteria bacterium]|nr:FtsH protease activity modulator HflK [Betaproteobacteria bacterium]